MIANYGFEDASGSYYISIDTDKCVDCNERGCVKGCPEGVFELEEDDWDNIVAVIKRHECNQIKSICAQCKQLDNRPELLPCQVSCGKQAILHSW